MIYIIQCMRPTCRFRFPLTDPDEVESLSCPKCAGPTETKCFFTSSKQELLSDATKSSSKIEVLLDNIRSAYNVGSILRTSDAAGIHHLHIAGFSPTPDSDKVRKTALGSEFSTPWTQHWNSLEVVKDAIQRGYQIIALEAHLNALSIFELDKKRIKSPTLFVLGNEVSGVDPEILALSDIILEIPMFGIKSSINVATAFGIGIYFIRSIELQQMI